VIPRLKQRLFPITVVIFYNSVLNLHFLIRVIKFFFSQTCVPVERCFNSISDLKLAGSIPDRRTVTQQLDRQIVPMFIKQYQLVPANGGDALKLER